MNPLFKPIRAFALSERALVRDMTQIWNNQKDCCCHQCSAKYDRQPYPSEKAGTLDQLRAAGSDLNTVDNYDTSGYFYPIPICQGVKKRRGRPEGKPHRFVRIECLTTQMFPYAMTEPDLTWNIMDVIKPYRRSHLRLSIYLSSITLPAQPTQPVISCGRDPPAN